MKQYYERKCHIRKWWNLTFFSPLADKYTKKWNTLWSCFWSVLCAKISRYSHYIYFLQEESTYFNLRTLKNFGLGYKDIFSLKNQTRKTDKIHKDFEPNQVFMSKCLDILIIYISYKKNWHILDQGKWRILDCGYRDIKSYMKNWQNSQEFLSYIKSSCITFSAKMSGYSQITYCLQEESTNFRGLKIFEVYQVFVYHLGTLIVYTTGAH